MEQSDLQLAQDRIGHRFARIELLELAFLHASFTDSRLHSNERLEFLGDAILGAVVCERIYELFPDLLEGEMTKIKSSAVSRRTCADIAEELGLDQLLVIGKGMQTDGDLPRSLAAGVLESVVGAIYLDAGFGPAREFLLRHFEPVIEKAARSGHQQNFKSVLQQHAQQMFGESPAYRVLDEKGPDHAKAFKVAVEVGGRLFEASWGQSKKQAEQAAALKVLHELGVIVEADDGELMLADDDAES